MNAPAHIKHPPLRDYVVPAIREIRELVNSINRQLAAMDNLAGLGAGASLAIQAEELAKTADTIKELAASIHRGIAKRNGLEPRT